MALKINAEDSRPPKLSVRFFTEYHIPVSALSVVVAIVVSWLRWHPFWNGSNYLCGWVGSRG